MAEREVDKLGTSLFSAHASPSTSTSGKLVGCQTLVARHGPIVYQSALGRMDRERDKPMRDDAIFRFYSMTKPITSVALMSLYEQGHFRLNDPVHRVIPEWRDQWVYVSGSGASMQTKIPDRPVEHRVFGDRRLIRPLARRAERPRSAPRRPRVQAATRSSRRTPPCCPPARQRAPGPTSPPRWGSGRRPRRA